MTMSVLYIVLPLALLVVLGMVWAFARSVRKGQFDDLETPALRMLFDDEPVRPRAESREPDGDTPPGAGAVHANEPASPPR
jgi:cbb3-type cytochrome oxidase maturation protein